MFLQYVLESNHELTFHGLAFTINVSKDRIALATRSVRAVVVPGCHCVFVCVCLSSLN